MIGSTAPNIPARNIRVYLPRGYLQNTTKRYPVLYLQDGQIVFDPGGPFGSWSADATATREIGQGRMREAILVAVNHGEGNRIPEYQPPTDFYPRTPPNTQGRADAYASFLINNVRPYVDTNFRTLNDPANTLTLGSSMGGLVSLYLGREFSVFGKIGIFSPAFWISPNYIAQVTAGTKKPLRVYLDMGTGEPEDNWEDAVQMYDVHLSQAYAANGEVTFVAGCGEGHNEAAWKARLPGALRFLLPVREEPALLALRDFPPKFSVIAVDLPGGQVTINYTSAFGFKYELARSPDMTDWAPVSTTSPESLPWSNRQITDTFEAATELFWQMTAIASP